MTKFNTGNPVGSSDPRDLFDNATVADKLVNGNAAAYNDRLGKTRKSWQGMESEFDQFLASSGYVGTGPDGVIEDYAEGIEVTAYNQIIRDSGEFWRASASTSLPYTTDGTGMSEGGAFVSVGDAALRQELSDQSGEGFGTDLVGHDGETARDAINQRVIYHPQLPVTAIANSADPLGYESEPNIIALKNEDLFCAYRRGSEHVSNDGRIVAKRSSDSGATWGPEIVIEDDETYDVRNHTVAYDEASGRIIVFYRKADADTEDHQGIFFRFSTDGGDSWGAEIDVSSENPSGALTAAPFGPAAHIDGTILVSVYGQGDSSNRLCWILRSADGGQTWSYYSTVYNETEATDYFLTETTIVHIGQGRIVAIIRNNDEGALFHWCKSSDGGATWGSVSGSRWVDPSAVVDFNTGETESHYRYGSGMQEVFATVQHDFSTDSVVNYPFPVDFKLPDSSTRAPTASCSPQNTSVSSRLNAYKDLVVMASNTGWNVSAQTTISETLDLNLGAFGQWDGPATNAVPINALSLNNTVMLAWGSRNDPETSETIGRIYIVEVDKNAFWQDPDVAWTKRRTSECYIYRSVVTGSTAAKWRDWGYPFLTKRGTNVLVSWYDSKDGTNETETDIYVKSVASIGS